MTFTSLPYLIFFPLVFIIYWLIQSNQIRKLWLLAASCFFYGWWDLRFLALLTTTVTIDYLAGFLIIRSSNKRVRKNLLVASVCSNIGVLAGFKYYDFFREGAESLFALIGIHFSPSTYSILLPIGISFYTFESLSFVIDCYRGKLKTEPTFLDFFLFVTFFPHLVAGPIVRSNDLIPQFAQKKRLHDISFRRSCFRLLSGFFKKAVIADLIGSRIDLFWAHPSGFSGFTCLSALLGYSIQIYFDFSGYSDMAIGFAGLFGYRLCENFNFPYSSCSVREFWTRWHISLSRWLRDYLYIPLGGNRKGLAIEIRNILITMSLGGLWHGANLKFVIWGILHGFALIVHRIWQSHGWYRPLPPLISRIATFTWWLSTLSFFRSNNSSDAIYILKQILFFSPGVTPTSLVEWLSGFGMIFIFLVLLKERATQIENWLNSKQPISIGIIYGVATALILFFMPLKATPFIYFQF